MKPLFTLALGLSLLLNVIFLFGLARSRPEEPSPSADNPASAAVTSVPSSAEPAIDPATWAALETPELNDLAARLRTGGFPPDVVRAIIKAQVGELFAARRRALDPEAESRPYWRNVIRDPKLIAAERELRREQTTMLREVLGQDPDADNPFAQVRESQQFGHVSPEKRPELREIMRTFDDRQTDVLGSPGVIGPAEREKLAAIEREQREALRAVLTPEEFLDYELRNSRTANSVRYELAAFDPTEAEFRAIFALRQPFDEQFNVMFGPIMSREDLQRRSEADKKVREQIKAALGPERGALYERASDFNYRRTSQLVARLELPPETTDQLYAVQKEFEQRRVTAMRSGGASREEMTEKMSALQAEALEKITPILRTPNAIEAYKQYGGNWLANMAPRPAPRD